MNQITQHILVVDDDEYLLEIIKTALESEGFRVSIIKDGKSALEMFRHDKPDLVVLDIKLPGLSGKEVLQAIRNISNIPVIMLTGLIDAETASQTINMGADDYIRKPFMPHEMVARVRATLRKSANSY